MAASSTAASSWCARTVRTATSSGAAAPLAARRPRASRPAYRCAPRARARAAPAAERRPERARSPAVRPAYRWSCTASPGRTRATSCQPSSPTLTPASASRAPRWSTARTTAAGCAAAAQSHARRARCAPRAEQCVCASPAAGCFLPAVQRSRTELVMRLVCAGSTPSSCQPAAVMQQHLLRACRGTGRCASRARRTWPVRLKSSTATSSRGGTSP